VSANVFKLESGCLQLLDRAYGQAPESLQHLKSHSLGNLYKYLTVKALQGNPEADNAIAALRFLGQAIKNDPSLLQKKAIGKIILRAGIISLLPPSLAKTVLVKFQKYLDPITLLGYLQYNPL
jgi:hypothetical protein